MARQQNPEHMKKSLTLIAVLLLTVFLSVPTVTLAKGFKSKKSTPAPVADTSDKISAVHLASITVSVHSPPASKEYKVLPATKITVNGQPGALSGLATGMDVVVTTAPDGVTAATVDAKSPGKK
jgi:ABC-type sulfate transport system permease subunit